MKKIMGICMALVLTFGIGLSAFAAPANSGSPEFAVSTSLTASSLEVFVGETVELTAVTSYTSNKANQLLYLSSENWTGVSSFSASASALERKSQFVSTATFSSDVPGNYAITYGIVVKHDESGKRTYSTLSSVTIKVVEKPVVAETRDPVNAREIYAHWKDDKSIAKGNGEYSNSWYHAQLDARVFYTEAEVIAFLDSIYVAK